MQILVTELKTYGPFVSVTESTENYVCDGTIYPKAVLGAATVQEVADDWLSPEAIAQKNKVQTERRLKAYVAESDPIFFKAQRGEATMQEWQDKVAEIKARFPKE